MLEVESKYRVVDFAPIRSRLTNWGATPQPPRVEIDHYFNGNDRDFAQTDEALRIRRIAEKNFVTYKGKRLDAVTKTRPEIEVPLGDGDDPAASFARMLELLGFRPVAVVHKRREVFGLDRNGFPVEVCLDDVEHVGLFVEVEVVTDPAQMEAAKAVVVSTAADLGLSEIVYRSYLRMLLGQ